MLANRVRMGYRSSGTVMGDDPIGSVGSQDLILGNRDKGYFGTVNGLINNTQLMDKMTMTVGVMLDPANTDITFHKFIHKGRILLIPSRPVKHSISWDNIQAQDGVKGRVIDIGGQKYLCRLMTGSRHYYTGNNSIAGGEWEDTFVEFHVSKGGILTDNDIYISGNGRGTWCQEVNDTRIDRRIMRPNGTVDTLSYLESNSVHIITAWRPILEVL